MSAQIPCIREKCRSWRSEPGRSDGYCSQFCADQEERELAQLRERYMDMQRADPPCWRGVFMRGAGKE